MALGSPPTPGLDSFVEAFESARGRGPADPADFLPPPGDPLRLAVLRELVRIDLEAGWTAGAPRRLDDYLAAFPELRADSEAAGDVAFEEYRQRVRAGQRPSPEEYALRYGVAVDGWPAHLTGQDAAFVQPTRVLGGMASPSEAPTRFAPDSEADEERSRLFEALSRCDPLAAERLQRGLAALPRVGDSFAGFRLVGQLGCGGFGVVFLARQGELADRPVALKVAADLGGETQTLAQMLHAHIVPVYSVHRSGPLQAICMPYLGRTTLSRVVVRLRALPAPPTSGGAILDALDQEPAPGDPGGRAPQSAVRDLLLRSTYVEAVLWLGARLADGLAHAHERGILHRDLKPANVLLTDEGLPLLLDFNLAADAKVDGVVAQVGGTLPYMAPEQMEAFRSGRGAPGAGADLFSLGVLLFQLLTGRHPYPERSGPLAEVLPLMWADRQRAPRLPPAPGVTPGVQAIVRQCLEPDPARRYRRASDLREDLERQRAGLPLRHAPNSSLRERLGKWARRHPRLTSFTGVSVLAGLLLTGLLAAFVARGQALARAHALDALTEARAELRQAQFALVTRTGNPDQLREGVAGARRVLDRYGALDDPSWQGRPDYAYLPPDKQAELRADLGEVLLLLARAAHLHSAALGDDGGPEKALALARRAAEVFPPGQAPPTLWRLRASLADQLGLAAEAAEARDRAAAAPRSVRDLYLEGADHAVSGRYKEALPLLNEATRRDPENFLAWYVTGYCFNNLALYGDAVASYTTCAALRPDFAPNWHNRARARLSRNDDARLDNRLAVADLDEALRLKPDLAEALVDRAFAHQRLNDPRAAVADLTRAVELRPGLTHAYFMRAQSRRQIGDAAGADSDEAEGVRREPDGEEGLLARGSFRLRADPAAALPDCDARLRQAFGWALTRAANDAALADFDAVLRRNPRSYPAIRNKVHLLAERLGRLPDAVALLDQALESFPDSAVLRAGRAVYRARLGLRDDARADLAICLRDDGSAATEYKAACVFALTAPDHPEDRSEALRHFAAALRKGYDRFDVIERDPDINALRSDPEFRRLVQAARELHK
jgi:serine/threonine protein kinase